MDGRLQREFETDKPSGLGFLSDGSTVVASMGTPQLLRFHEGAVESWMDLSSMALHLNDLVVDRRQRVFADAYGTDPRQSGKMVAVVNGGPARVVADGLEFPNGVAVTPDGGMLIVSETFAGHLTAFDVGDDGSLSARRVWAAVDGMSPDGLCLDAEGAVWVASYRTGEFFRVGQGGKILRRVSLAPRWALSCALGGPDGCTLLLCTADTSTKEYFAGRSTGHLDTIRVDVPGVGCP
jgi:sugar lactone lactonase YvrE